MSTTGIRGYKWGNATQGIVGQNVYLSAADTVDFTTAVTNRPIGVLLNAPKQNETAQVALGGTDGPGNRVLMLVDGTTDIAVGDLLKTNATGRGIKATFADATATEAWTVGIAEEAFTVNGDGLISVIAHRQIAKIA